MTEADSASRAALAAVSGIPGNEEGPVFGAPWQAQAFAMAVTLEQRGVFTWVEWADALGAARADAASAGSPDTGDAHYRDWLATLEIMVTTRGIAGAHVLSRTHDAWSRAAARTGSPS